MRFQYWLFGLVAMLTALLFLAGCGGGEKSLTLLEPKEGSGDGSVSGTVFSLVEKKIDYPYGATVTLTRIDDSGNPVSGFTPLVTHSTISGTYQFPGVPKGRYQLHATITSSVNANLTLSNTISGIEVRAALPTMMANILIGDPTKLVAFTGKVTESGQAPTGGIVSIEVDAQPADQSLSSVAVILSTATASDGSYAFTVPNDAIAYILAAHSDTSAISESPRIIPPLTEASRQVNFTLTTITKPITTNQILYVVSSTLPAPTETASMQALTTRLAVARSLNASPARIAQLEKLASGRAQVQTRTVNAPTGIVENDLTWDAEYLPYDDVRGYNLYRSSSQDGSYTHIGSVNDPYQTVFSDTDPSLQLNGVMYYTVTSYAAHGVTSKPCTPQAAKPLPQITVHDIPDVVTGGRATLQWDPVPGAKGYILLVFNAPPTFNSYPNVDQTRYGLRETDTSMTITSPGTYWWGVSAYNTPTDGNKAMLATAISYTTYRKLVVMP